MSGGDGFSTVQRVRFGDLDAMQHMNNVEFLRFFETARIEYISTLAPDHAPTSPTLMPKSAACRASVSASAARSTAFAGMHA